jgi:hypothetical protein
MRRLELIVGGVQKAGTSSLFGYLAAHPGLAPPVRKELHFFDDERIDWSAPDYSALEAAFAAEEGGLRFEATPIYLFWPRALERIQRYNPAVKLIFVFREPVARAWSHWRMERKRGQETRPFSDAIRSAPVGASGLRHHSYVARGLYAQQLERALMIFDPGQMLLLTADELMADPRGALARIAAFLRIAPFPDMLPRRENVGVPMGEVPAVDAAYLRAVYRADTARFAALSGLAIDNWWRDEVAAV